MSDSMQEIGIFSQPINRQLQELRAGLIQYALGRVEQCVSQRSWLSQKAGKKGALLKTKFYHTGDGLIEVAMRYLTLMNENPDLSNDDFLGLYKQALDAVKGIDESTSMTIAWVGASKYNAKRAVAGREDQKLKPGWKRHCRTVFESGTSIKNITSFLEVAGYDPKLSVMDRNTLKKWVKEEIPGLTFKRGR